MMFTEEFDGTDPMQCDEELLRGMEARAKILGGRWFSDMTPAEARRTFATLSSVHRNDPVTKREVAHVSDEVIDFDGEPMTLRVYRPRAVTRAPVIVYFHGGGWVFGDIESFDETARLICDECAAIVVSVNYPLAPEHRFPAPFVSCIESVLWVKHNIASHGGDPDRVMVMGDSAGGNLAAAAALECTRRGIDLIGQAILYAPLVHFTLTQEAGVREWDDRDQRFGPTYRATSWYWGNYVETPELAKHPRASILLESDMQSAPPALIAAGLLDTFCEESIAYGHRLADSGVKVSIRRYPRVTHGFISHGWMPRSHRSQRAYDATMDTLQKVKQLIQT
jgi:acetyl esterase